MYKRFFQQILPRRFLPVLMLLAQVFLLLYTLLSGSVLSQITQAAMVIFAVAVSISVAAGHQKSAFKVGWILLILLMPLFGVTVYVMFNHQKATKWFATAVAESCRAVESAYRLPYAEPEYPPEPHRGLSRYLDGRGFPVYKDTESRFYPLGEEAFSAMLEAMEQAKTYIFLEFFIIEEGEMWDSILAILRKKAAQGVQVRLIYDDLGCFFLLRPDYPRLLKEYGIQCVPFNPFRPLLTAKQNNRDHRKILSVDGKVAFTGGVNLADEYINAVNKFGHWKDTMVRLEGPGAWGLTAMFLQSWRLCSGQQEDPAQWYTPHHCAGGMVQPYCDSPMDRENVGEAVYLQIIHSAREYLYITTPYLIVDDAMVAALILAAKRGVDVRIVTPHRWDKRLVHITTRSYYRELLQGGVKILEYTPGFIHSKVFVCDDSVATVGTVNMDFRSLYLHFECGVCLYDASAVAQVRSDTKALFSVCQPITLADCRSRFLSRLVQDVMRLFAPLM